MLLLAAGEQRLHDAHLGRGRRAQRAGQPVGHPRFGIEGAAGVTVGTEAFVAAPGALTRRAAHGPARSGWPRCCGRC
jgi:hypothetical protein